MAVEVTKPTLELKSIVNGVEYEALPSKIKPFYALEYQAYGDAPKHDRYKLNLKATGLLLTEASAVFKAEKERIEGAAAKVKVTGNPWKKGTAAFNLTDQGLVLKHDPALAARLQLEAKAG